MKKLSYLIGILVWVVLGSCTTKWSKAIQSGKVGSSTYHEVVQFETSNYLIMVPVKIKGEDYRFLLDTGAPFSISEEVQAKMNFRQVTKSMINDTDGNRTQVDYVEVDTLWIGNLPFVEQTAFVGDFTANPILKCMDFDGIIGSNLMRHSNWIIDYHKKSLQITQELTGFEDALVIDFKPNIQYSMKTSFTFSGHEVENMTIDYGSAGAIGIPSKDLDLFADKYEVVTQEGTKTSGIVGKPVQFSRRIINVDSLILGDDVLLDNVEIRTSGSKLIGIRVWSRFIVGIDWDNNQLLLLPNGKEDPRTEIFGFTAGPSEDHPLSVLSVFSPSKAHDSGLRTGMKIIQVDEFIVSENFGLCEYMEYLKDHQDPINLVLEDQDGRHQITVKKESISEKN